MIEFWVAVLALTILLYVLLDGFDLGVGILLALAPDETDRRQMLAAISPVWDGNETWLIVNATVLFGIFPLVYSLILSAFYLPLMVMLAGLILRGVSFEFRERSLARRWFWDGCFIVGSTVATFIQGAAVGGLVQGLDIQNGQYVGGPLGWLSPFPLLCGVGLCFGYALLGAGWLAWKADAVVQALAYRILPWLVAGVAVFFVIGLGYALAVHLPVLDRWQGQPLMLVVPLVGVLACLAFIPALRSHRDWLPFLCAVTLFLSAFAALALSFYPYMIPFSVTVADAAAPESSQNFLFWGAGLVALPLTLIYTVVVYVVFRGKAARNGREY